MKRAKARYNNSLSFGRHLLVEFLVDIFSTALLFLVNSLLARVLLSRCLCMHKQKMAWLARRQSSPCLRHWQEAVDSGNVKEWRLKNVLHHVQPSTSPNDAADVAAANAVVAAVAAAESADKSDAAANSSLQSIQSTQTKVFGEHVPAVFMDEGLFAFAFVLFDFDSNLIFDFHFYLIFIFI